MTETQVSSLLSIRHLESRDIAPIAAAFMALGWHKPASQYEKYLAEQEAGERIALVAFISRFEPPGTVEAFAGYVTIRWQSPYPPFREQNIPEIVDFNVLPGFRRQGIGSRLMDEAERRVAAVSPVVGLGVGLTADYGSAQRMYVKRGYLPDGRGLYSHDQPAQYGQSVLVDDDLVLYLTKTFKGDFRSAAEKTGPITIQPKRQP